MFMHTRHCTLAASELELVSYATSQSSGWSSIRCSCILMQRAAQENSYYIHVRSIVPIQEPTHAPSLHTFPGGLREEVTLRREARDSIRASGGDIRVVGRTDCRLAENTADDGFEEAMWRCEAFADLGADVVYFEAPEGEDEMRAPNRRIREVPTMLAQVPGRELLTSERCADLGYDAVYVRTHAAQRVRRGCRPRSAWHGGEPGTIEGGRGGREGGREHCKGFNFKIILFVTNTPKRIRSRAGSYLEQNALAMRHSYGSCTHCACCFLWSAYATAQGRGQHPTAPEALMPFDELYDVVGFSEHFELEARFDPDAFLPSE